MSLDNYDNRRCKVEAQLLEGKQVRYNSDEHVNTERIIGKSGKSFLLDFLGADT